MNQQSVAIFEEAVFGKEQIMQRFITQATSITNAVARRDAGQVIKQLQQSLGMARLKDVELTPFPLREMLLSEEEAGEFERLKERPSSLIGRRLRRMQSMD